jgi:hypothetical protein
LNERRRSPVECRDRHPQRPRAVLGFPAAAVFVSLLLTLSACTPEPLPEEGSPSAQLYVKTCGQCHMVYRPRLLTAKMWESMVERMEIQMRRRRVPFPAADREEILAYLRRNAGGR